VTISKYWPVAVIGLAAVVLGANFFLVYLAVSDPSFAVEPNYYQKALDWDEHRSQEKSNLDLGWKFNFNLAMERGPDGTLELRALLFDRDGLPIDNARIKVETFHNAMSAYPLEADLEATGDGAYTAALPIRRPGLWEFRFVVDRDDQRFMQTEIREVGWRR
jgi:nitrogen fixation protein FixH